MTIVDRIEQETRKKKEEFEKEPEFQSLRDFYSEMQSLGIAKKPEYSMPPLDTIGRRLYETAHSSTRKLF